MRGIAWRQMRDGRQIGCPKRQFRGLVSPLRKGDVHVREPVLGTRTGALRQDEIVALRCSPDNRLTRRKHDLCAVKLITQGKVGDVLSRRRPPGKALDTLDSRQPNGVARVSVKQHQRPVAQQTHPNTSRGPVQILRHAIGQFNKL